MSAISLPKMGYAHPRYWRRLPGGGVISQATQLGYYESSPTIDTHLDRYEGGCAVTNDDIPCPGYSIVRENRLENPQVRKIIELNNGDRCVHLKEDSTIYCLYSQPPTTEPVFDILGYDGNCCFRQENDTVWTCGSFTIPLLVKMSEHVSNYGLAGIQLDGDIFVPGYPVGDTIPGDPAKPFLGLVFWVEPMFLYTARYVCTIKADTPGVACFSDFSGSGWAENQTALLPFPNNVTYVDIFGSKGTICVVRGDNGRVECEDPIAPVWFLEPSMICTPQELTNFASDPRIQQMVLPSSLSTLPTNDWSGWTSLSSIIVPNQLSAIPAGGFAGMSQVTSLDLSSTQIKSLPSGAFRGLTGLSVLRWPLELHSIEGDLFDPSGVPGLATFNISHLTRLTSLPARVLSGLTNVNSVLLPPTVTAVASRVFADGIFKPTFANLPSYPGVMISMPGVVHLPPEMFHGSEAETQLTYLGNTLPLPLTIHAPSAISAADGFMGMHSLARLKVTVSPAFRSDDDQGACGMFSGLPALQHLEVFSGSRLFGLEQDLTPDGFASCSFNSSIETLALSGMNISLSEWTTDTFTALTNLKTLNVTDTAGATSPGFFLTGAFLSPLVQLKILDIQNNRLGSLPRLSSVVQENLVHIVLHGNNAFQDVVADAFDGLFAVQSLLVTTGLVCPPGTAKAGLAAGAAAVQAFCVRCQPGHYCPDGRNSIKCPRGTYLGIEGANNVSQCTQCPTGTTTTLPASLSSEDCVGVIISCPKGTAGSGEENACEPCASGKYSPGGDVRQCLVCPPGQVTATRTLASACIDCPAHTYIPTGGFALLSSCKPCGEGLISLPGSSSCMGCPKDTVFDKTTLTCITKDDVCNAEHTLCIAGLPEPVPAPVVMRDILSKLDLPFDAPLSNGRQLDARYLRVIGQAAQLSRVLALSPPQNATEFFSTQPVEEYIDNSSEEERNSILSTVIQGVMYIVTGSLAGALVLTLVLSCTRGWMHHILPIVDQMAKAHSVDNFSAVRNVRTVAGGVFSLFAALTGIALSGGLVSEYFLENTLQTDSLQVLISGNAESIRASQALADMSLDVVFRPASFVDCMDDKLTYLTVKAGVNSISSNSPDSSLFAASNEVTEFVSTASLATVQADGDGWICSMRATCRNCSLSSAVTISVTSHWSSQVMAWRLATRDAAGQWSASVGVSVPPSAVGVSTKTTGDLIQSNTESLNFVGHLLEDSRKAPSLKTEGFVTQNMQMSESIMMESTSLNPGSTTSLTFSVQKSAVYATSKLNSKTTFTQLLSAIVGLLVGVMGGFTVVFTLWEKFFGSRCVWMCGEPGIIDSEEDAVLRRRKSMFVTNPALKSQEPKQSAVISSQSASISSFKRR